MPQDISIEIQHAPIQPISIEILHSAAPDINIDLVTPQPQIIEVSFAQVGPQGPPGSGVDAVEDETPTGIVDGSNATYTTEFEFIPASVEAFINGLKQKPIIHFITTGTQTIILADSPQVGDQILINYQKA